MSERAYADAVIVAAGSSSRMGGTDKLDAEILGWPVLRWAAETLAAAPEVARVIVVTAADRLGGLSAAPWIRAMGARVVPGGPRRQDSVAQGVRASRAEVVLVHDAARPLLSAGIVARVASEARAHGAAIPLVPVSDSLKRVAHGTVSGALTREGVYRAQTPQGARRDLLLAAVEAHAGGEARLGDEAELLALDGVTVRAVDGDPMNVKVTEPADLELARRLASGARPSRFATGQDTHPFGPGDGLRLGGLTIPDAPRLHGHSDGDACLHALCDALLAASGLGDLGRHFPPGDPDTRGVDSRELLAAVLRRVAQAGHRPASVDVTILGSRPRLGAERLESMRALLAEALDLDVAAVAVKASTGNLQGPEGAGRAISASCLVSVVPR